MFLFILMLIIVFVLLGLVRDIINFSNFNFSFNSPKPGQRRVYAASLLNKRQKLWRTAGRPSDYIRYRNPNGGTDRVHFCHTGSF